MSDLADAVLPLIRTRRELHWRRAASDHGEWMHDAVDLLELARSTADPAEVHRVTHRALMSAITVIARADDSDGIVGDACRRLLDLHPGTAVAARVPSARLVDWMIRFQTAGEVDYFELDPVAYAPALGDRGLASYRTRLDQIRAELGPEPDDSTRFTGPDARARWVLDWNDRRLSVLDRDVEAIVRTHARDQRVAAYLADAARALAEIGEIDAAADWARRGMDVPPRHQALQAADYWCALLADHRPAELTEARLLVFRRWPSSTTATRLHRALGDDWPRYRTEVIETLTASPRDAVLFALRTLHDLELAWGFALSLDLQDDRMWSDLVAAYEKVEPLAVLPAHRRLVEADLTRPEAQSYRSAARRLTRMRRLAAGSDAAASVDDYVTELRETHRRRPRLQLEFDRAGLP